MVWGCMCFNGIRTLTHVESNINVEKYIKIIDNNLWPVIARHFPDDTLQSLYNTVRYSTVWDIKLIKN